MAREDLIPNEPGLIEQLALSLAPRLATLNSRTEKTREAAATLFFTHGIYPSAQKVRAITQHGSLSDINTDLAAFWRDLRSRAKVTLDLPDFPDALRDAFSESLNQVWMLANERATDHLASARDEAQREVAQAHDQTRQLQERYDLEVRQGLRLRDELAHEREARIEQERRAEGLVVEVAMLGEQIKQLENRLAKEAAARLASEERFSDELNQERGARKNDLEVFERELAYSKLQIDRARQEAKEQQASAITERQRLNEEVLTYRRRASALEDELMTARKQLRDAVALQATRSVAVKPGVGKPPAAKPRALRRKNQRTKMEGERK